MIFTLKSTGQKSIFAKTLFGICFLFILGFTPGGSVRIFLIGDSTMADKPIIDNPEHGWGQVFPIFFNDEVQIFNHAKNGRSTKNFIAQGRWEVVYNQLKPGDYVFIQFGHNDAKKEDTLRFAPPRPDYKNNLKKFINESKNKGAIPILLTPITRRDFDSEGRYKGTHGEYPVIMKEVAKEENVPLIDMFEKTKNFIELLGNSESKKFYLAGVQPNEFRNWNGKKDDTHFTRIGAVKMASFVAEGIRELKLPLADKLIDSQFPDLIGTGKVVGLDYSMNANWKYKKDSTKIYKHCAWEDSTETGLAYLGNIIDRLGANLDTLQSLPKEQLLKRLSIYIIINQSKHKSDESDSEIKKAIINVTSWVKKGGILIMMEDEGKPGCAYFNKLAKNFGIEFIRKEVRANDIPQLKKYKNLSLQKIFNNLVQLNVKDVSTLKIKKSHQSILDDNGFTVMASLKMGKGMVLAIGNCWLMNKYLDLLHLSAENENIKAARNLFEWLLKSQ